MNVVLRKPENKSTFGKYTKTAKRLKGFVNKKWERIQSAALKKVGKYAWGRFATANVTRNYANMIPLMIVSMIIRMFVNWILFYRLRSGRWFLDFCIAIVISVFTSVISPFFYAIAETKKKELLKITNNTLDHLFGIQPTSSGQIGWAYLLDMRNKIFLCICCFLLIVLQFVEITSYDIQEFIIHLLISSWIVDKFQQWQEYIMRPKWFVVERDITVLYYGPRQLNIRNYIKIPCPKVLTMGIHTKLITSTNARIIEPRDIRLYLQQNNAKVQHVSNYKGDNKSRIVNIQRMHVIVNPRKSKLILFDNYKSSNGHRSRKIRGIF